MVKLLQKVKDTLTDFEGTVTARCTYAYQCASIQVTAIKLKDGAPNAQWLDEDRLITAPRAKKKPTGGMHDTPPSRSHPGG